MRTQKTLKPWEQVRGHKKASRTQRDKKMGVEKISPTNSAGTYKKALISLLFSAAEEENSRGKHFVSTSQPTWMQSHYLVVKQGLQHGTC